MPDGRGLPSGVAGAALVAAGLLAALRIARWRLWALRGRPDLLCLAAGYAWLAVGLVLFGAAHSGVAMAGQQALALHVITIGSLGTLTLNVMAMTRLLKLRRSRRARGCRCPAHCCSPLQPCCASSRPDRAARVAADVRGAVLDSRVQPAAGAAAESPAGFATRRYSALINAYCANAARFAALSARRLPVVRFTLAAGRPASAPAVSR